MMRRIEFNREWTGMNVNECLPFFHEALTSMHVHSRLMVPSVLCVSRRFNLNFQR